MAIVEMRKLVVIGLNATRTPFIQELMPLGVVQINSQEGTVNDTEWMPDIFRTSNRAGVLRLEADLARIQTALTALNTYSEEKKPLIAVRKELDEDEFIHYMNRNRTEIERNVDTAFLAGKAIEDGKNEINRLQSQILGLQPWVNLDVPLSLQETESTCLILGATSAKIVKEKVMVSLQEAVPAAVVQVVAEDAQQVYYAIICLKEEREQLMEVLRAFAFNVLSFANETLTPKEAIAEHEERIAELHMAHEIWAGTLASMKEEKRNIEYLYDSMSLRRDRAQIVGSMLNTEEVFYFDGWCPLLALPKVEALLQRYEYYYRVEEAQEGEQPPVLLHNSGFATPFESITNMYSLPGLGDLDPTKYLAPFYFIFFGMMLSDAAYGLIITAVCAWALKKYALEGSLQKMVKMFFYCGISTFFWGAMFGGWFGDLATVIGRTFFGVEFVIAPLWFNPLEEPMTLLVFSLILGAIHLFVGMGLQASVLIKQGRTADAIFDIGLWYVLLIGLVLLGVGPMVSPVLGTIGTGMSVVGAVGIVATGGRTKKNIIGKITGGLGSLYGITSYLSDVLSYSRLLALGLATGVVAQVINLLGSLAGGGIQGALLLTVAFLFGTVFNIAINALGAFVHACRLQYVEFFGKFYTGGGKAFAPFERKTKYIKLMKEEKNNG